MSWLTITISVYFILAVVFLVDKYLLTSPIPNPKVYVFYIGALGTLAILLAPFTGFYFPEVKEIFIGISAGIFFMLGLFWFYKALSIFEISRVVPAVGGLTPLFTFGLIYFISGGKESLTLPGFIAFLLLVLGSVIIVSENNNFLNLKSLKISVIAAFFLSLSFVLLKYLYLSLPFWTGFIWKSLGGTLFAGFIFIIFPEIRKEIFKKREKSSSKIMSIFLANQGMGATANVLQNWAVALVPLAYVAFVNALQGVQYVFLFIFAVLLSMKFPKILKEEISRKIIIQKVAAILIIGTGLVILSF